MAKDLTRVIAVLSTWTKSNTGLRIRDHLEDTKTTKIGLVET